MVGEGTLESIGSSSEDGTSLSSVADLYSCLAGGSQNGLEGLLGMASEAQKVGRRIPRGGAGAIR